MVFLVCKSACQYRIEHANTNSSKNTKHLSCYWDQKFIFGLFQPATVNLTKDTSLGFYSSEIDIWEVKVWERVLRRVPLGKPLNLSMRVQICSLHDLLSVSPKRSNSWKNSSKSLYSGKTCTARSVWYARLILLEKPCRRRKCFWGNVCSENRFRAGPYSVTQHSKAL